MSTRPSNGPDLSYRDSNLKSKNNRFKAQLAQGDEQRRAKEILQQKIDIELQLKKEKKAILKKQAEELDKEYGFVTESVEERNMPEWKKHKIFLNAVFPAPVMCFRYKNQIVFKNKLTMQRYRHSVATPEEWEHNLSLIAEMRLLYDAQNSGNTDIHISADKVGSVLLDDVDSDDTDDLILPVPIPVSVDETDC